MDQEYEERINRFIEKNSVECEHLVFEHSCHSVREACKATGATPSDFIKSVCFLSGGGPVVAIVSGSDRASLRRVMRATGLDNIRLANSEEVEEHLGYPAGGVPPIGYKACVLLDDKLIDKEMVWAGGGSVRSLMRISPKEISRISNAKIIRVRK